MKTKQRLITAVLSIIAILCVAYYGYFIVYRSLTGDANTDFTTKFKFGLVQTTADQDTSYITYYDGDFKKVYTQKVKCGAIGDTADNPQSANSKVYFVPQDTATTKDSSKVVSINLTDGDKKNYDVNQTNITNYQVDMDAIYTSVTKGNEILVSKYVKKTKESSTLSLGAVTLDLLSLHNDKLFAFTSDQGKSLLQMIDPTTMTVIKTFSISDFSGKVTDAVFSGDSLYFIYEDPSNTINPTGIGNFNLFNKEVTTVPLTLAHASQVFHSDDMLIVTADNSNQVAVYDATEETEHIYELKNNSVQSYVSGGSLYSMDATNFYEYDLSDFSVKDKIELPIKESNNATYHYSCFFAK